MNNIENKIDKVMRNFFNIVDDDILENLTVHGIKKWDSLGHIQLMIEIEKEFNISLNEDAISSMVNYKNIVATLKTMNV